MITWLCDRIVTFSDINQQLKKYVSGQMAVGFCLEVAIANSVILGEPLHFSTTRETYHSPLRAD